MEKKDIVILCDSYIESYKNIEFCITQLHKPGDTIHLIQLYNYFPRGKMLTRDLSSILRNIATDDLTYISGMLTDKYSIDPNNIKIKSINNNIDEYISSIELSINSLIIIPTQININIKDTINYLRSKSYVLILLPVHDDISHICFINTGLNYFSIKIFEQFKNYLSDKNINIEIHLPKKEYMNINYELKTILNKPSKHEHYIITSNTEQILRKLNNLGNEIIIIDLESKYIFKESIKNKITSWFS